MIEPSNAPSGPSSNDDCQDEPDILPDIVWEEPTVSRRFAFGILAFVCAVGAIRAKGD